MKNPLLPLALFAAAACAPAQVRLFVDDHSFTPLLARPAFYDGLMVATALAPPVGHPLPGETWLASQPVRVEDSRAFAPGTVVTVFFEMGGSGLDPLPRAGVPIDPTGTLPVGRRVLLIAQAAKSGALVLQGRGQFVAPEERSVALDPASGPSVSQLKFFPTTAARLPDDPEPRWRLLGGIAAAIPGADDANAREIADYLGDLRIKHHAYDGQADDRLSRLFADAVAKDTAYHRALVDLALNHLEYLGYEQRWVRDLHAAAEDPNAFPDGLPAPSLMFHEDPMAASTWPKDYKPLPPTSDEEDWNALMRAKSPTIAAAFLKDLKRPSDADARALATRFLAFPDPRARWAMVERLAWWNGHVAPDKPTQVLDPAARSYRMDYPGLDEAVAYWRAKLGV